MLDIRDEFTVGMNPFSKAFGSMVMESQKIKLYQTIKKTVHYHRNIYGPSVMFIHNGIYQFDNCIFDLRLNHSILHHCYFHMCKFVGCYFNDVFFQSCDFRKCMFDNCKMKYTFIECSLDFVYIIHHDIRDSKVEFSECTSYQSSINGEEVLVNGCEILRTTFTS